MKSVEINYRDRNWMIQLGTLSRVASRVVVKNFIPNCHSIGFVRTILSDNDLFVSSWDENLVLEKRVSLVTTARESTVA